MKFKTNKKGKGLDTANSRAHPEPQGKRETRAP